MKQEPEEEPRATDAGPGSTSETRETRTVTTEVHTSSDVQTSTSSQDENVSDQRAQATGDQRGDATGDQRGEATGDQRGEATGDQRGDATGDQRGEGDVAPEGSSLGRRIGDKLGLTDHGNQTARDETDR
jgi:hypothetical protein